MMLARAFIGPNPLPLPALPPPAASLSLHEAPLDTPELDGPSYTVKFSKCLRRRRHFIVAGRSSVRMSGRKREITGLMNEWAFPHLLELALPPGGFRSPRV
jgi:hypothetical protein